MSRVTRRFWEKKDDLRGKIELEKAASPTPSQAAAASPWIVQEPVPARPLHLCPNCDYNLTGLIERRCPECGEPFDLADARFRGFERSEDGARVRRWEKLDWVKRGLGVAMIILGFWCPTIADAVFASGSNVLSTTAKTWLMMFMVAPGDVAFAMVALYLELGWTRTLLTLGVATMVAGLLVALL